MQRRKREAGHIATKGLCRGKNGRGVEVVDRGRGRLELHAHDRKTNSHFTGRVGVEQ